ncbi:MAG: tyrosine--tRNA ligase, partial [Chloroflexota bacterium]|nr:tyrosine--tRNA ligase [Chloroflexota bacterium]
LHVGNLLGIMLLATLQRFGHRPIALGGGGTALVGDPTGKTSARALISPQEIDANLTGVLPQFDRYLDFAGDRFGDNPAALLIDNATWLMELHYIPFLRDIGRHFSVNEMLAAETYKVRLASTGLNFVEFNYRIVQAYDFLHLFRTEGCLLQAGGSDQWGNIVAGVELIRRVTGGQAFALVTPLITTKSGEKMGKTASGDQIWLDPRQTSPYEYYQFWINTPDEAVGQFLRYYTFLPEERITELTATRGAALREAKRVLAFEATALTHGEELAHLAAEAAQNLFANAVIHAPTATATASAGSATMTGGAAIEAPTATATASAGPATMTGGATIPTTEMSTVEIAEGFSLADLFVRAGLTTSRGEARRLASQGGLRFNDQRVDNVDIAFAATAGSFLLRAGKKRFHRIVIR